MYVQYVYTQLFCVCLLSAEDLAKHQVYYNVHVQCTVYMCILCTCMYVYMCMYDVHVWCYRLVQKVEDYCVYLLPSITL